MPECEAIALYSWDIVGCEITRNQLRERAHGLAIFCYGIPAFYRLGLRYESLLTPIAYHQSDFVENYRIYRYDDLGVGIV